MRDDVADSLMTNPDRNHPDLSPSALADVIRSKVAAKTFSAILERYPEIPLDDSLLTEYAETGASDGGGDFPNDFLIHALFRSGLRTESWDSLLEGFASVSGFRLPFLGFADRMAVPLEFYSQDPDIAELCRLLQAPILQAETGGFFVLASVNPITAADLAAEISRLFRERGVIVPVAFPVRTDFESWQRLCRRHFAS